MKILPLVLLLLWWVASTLIRKVNESSPKPNSSPQPSSTRPVSPDPSPVWQRKEGKSLEEQLFSWLDLDEEKEEEKKEPRVTKRKREAEREEMLSPPITKSVQPDVLPPLQRRDHAPKKRPSHPLQRLTHAQLMQAVVLKEVLDPPLARRPLRMRRSAPLYRDQGR